MSQPGSVPLSVLDLAPVLVGQTTAEALHDSVALARAAEELGYHRYWVAEHHNAPGAASSAPAVLIGQIAAATSRLRVGSGGVMLPNHAPLVVAEQFGTLAAFHPGRIDLGLGRAPGTDPVTAQALRRAAGPLAGGDFPRQAVELLGYFDGPQDEAEAALRAVPAEGNRPEVWVLGSGLGSAELAGSLGLPFAYAHQFNAQLTVPALRAYRESFRPSAVLERPHALVAAFVLAAETAEDAERLAGPIRVAAVRTVRSGGRQNAYPTLEEAAAFHYTEQDRQIVEGFLGQQVIGDRALVRRRVAELVSAGADEFMAMTVTPDLDSRVASYRILAEEVAALGSGPLAGVQRG
ncbi:LLM class flavin-dependent oxidoreductase [Kitasatospora sp. NPDC048239]|uniref:LLM class flavin-dependent oxidoreductase n=1 Tax=Kitasatospora sp. NPDC048239 TaxID=3364046 RepID=UPI003713C364